MIIALRISEQEDLHRHEIPHEKMQEIDKKARISKKAKMKRRFNRNQKCITLWDIQLSCLTSLHRLINLTCAFHIKGFLKDHTIEKKETFYSKSSEADFIFCHMLQIQITRNHMWPKNVRKMEAATKSSRTHSDGCFQ